MLVEPFHLLIPALDPGTEKVTLVATDSRRLAVAPLPVRSEGVTEPVNPGPVIPAKAMRLIEKSISDDEEEVLVAISANDILIVIAQWGVTCP